MKKMKSSFLRGAVSAGLGIALIGLASPAYAQDEIDGEVQITGPLGLTQNAWNEYLRNRGESKDRPGYVRYEYDPQQAFPIRIREGMITTIKLPEGEEIVEAYVGDDAGFNVGIPNPRNIVVKANFPGVDSNLIAYAESGNIYTFYLRSEAYNSKQISDFLVDVTAGKEQGYSAGSSSSGVVGGSFSPEQQAAYDEKNPYATATRVRDPYATMPTAIDPRYREYSEWTDFDPTKIKEDLGVYVPLKQTGGTIPYRVFRDDRFTYIDYGPEASKINEWPAPMIVIQGVEGPVGNRTTGPGGRMIVIEALGDFVLRNGKRIIVVKPRSSSPDAGLVEYPTAANAKMEVPRDLPPGRSVDVPTRPQTVLPVVTQQPTAENEFPSAVVGIKDQRGVVPTKIESSISYVSSAVIQETPVAKGGGAPIREVVATGSAPSEATMNATGAALGASGSTVGTSPKQIMPQTGVYYISLGEGQRQALEDKWRSAKVQHYDLLLGRDPVYSEGASGTELRIEGFETARAAIAVCEAMTEQSVCAVRSKN